MTIQKELLSAKEASEYLGVTEGTLAVWRCDKRYSLTYIKVGHLVKYRKSDLDSFIASRAVGNNFAEAGAI